MEAVIPPNCTAGSSYYIEIDYTAPMQHATSYSRTDTFMIRDYAEFVADRYMAASRGNINQDELDRLCEEASHAHGKYLNGRNTLVVYGEMACRCLEYLSSGFDCYGLHAIMPLTPGDPDPIMVSSSSSFIGSEIGTVVIVVLVLIVCGGILAAWCRFRRRLTSNSNSSGHSSDVTNPGNEDSEAKLSKDVDTDPGLVPHNFRGVQRSVARGAADPCVPGQMLGELVVAHVSVTVSV
jgi:hypothetical protein